jgi:hypothetical protein
VRRGFYAFSKQHQVCSNCSRLVPSSNFDDLTIPSLPSRHASSDEQYCQSRPIRRVKIERWRKERSTRSGNHVSRIHDRLMRFTRRPGYIERPEELYTARIAYASTRILHRKASRYHEWLAWKTQAGTQENPHTHSYAYNFQREHSGFTFYLEIRTRRIVPWFVQAALSMTSAVDAGVEAVFFLGWIFSEKSTC